MSLLRDILEALRGRGNARELEELRRRVAAAVKEESKGYLHDHYHSVFVESGLTHSVEGTGDWHDHSVERMTTVRSFYQEEPHVHSAGKLLPDSPHVHSMGEMREPWPEEKLEGDNRSDVKMQPERSARCKNVEHVKVGKTSRGWISVNGENARN